MGDPTGRTTSREVLHTSVRRANLANMHLQVKRLWANMEAHARNKYGYVKTWAWKRGLVNNSAWMNKLSVIDFLKELGNEARVGTMLAKDT